VRKLDSKKARRGLRASAKPYYRAVEPGLALGYRRLTGKPGSWVARRYNGDGRYAVTNLRASDGSIVIADDHADADGDRILSFAQAQTAARATRPNRHTAADYTIGDSLTDYLRYLEIDGRSQASIYDTRNRIETFIRPALGAVKTATLTTERLEEWRDKVAKTPARIRTGNGLRQRHRKTVGEDGERARRSSANRTWSILRAALNRGFQTRKIESDLAWRLIKPFANVGAARVRYFSLDECRRFLNACASDSDFHELAQAGLQTGCRYGELVRLEVGDFNVDSGTLHIRRSKTGKARHVVLTDEGVNFFRRLTAGRPSNARMLHKRWSKCLQAPGMKRACERAGLAPTGFHTLRHTWASLSVMAGVPLMVVARNLGHTDTRMVERHYGHLSQSYLADAIRRGAPQYGIELDSKVTSLGSRR
jgi:integrase